jgi:hypothetical protein
VGQVGTFFVPPCKVRIWLELDVGEKLGFGLGTSQMGTIDSELRIHRKLESN